jgi:hypothetical protein
MTRRAVEQHLDEWTGVDGKGALEPNKNQLLDYDRGLVLMVSGAGLAVGMYPDTPGEYWLANGQRASEAQAQEVGFDIQQGRKLRRDKDIRARAMTAVQELADAEEAKAQDAMRQVADAEESAADAARNTLQT